MSSENMTTLNNNPQLVFEDETTTNLRFSTPKTVTRELTGFIDDRFFSTQPPEFRHNWNASTHTHSADGSHGDGDEDEDDDDDDEDDYDDEDEGIVVAVDDHDSANKNNNNTNNSSNSSAAGDKIANTNANAKPKHLSSFGSSREMIKEGSIVPCGNVNNDMRANSSENHQEGRVGQYQNAVTIADPDGDLYFSQYLPGPEGSAVGQKDMVVENGCGFSGRKDVSYSSESGESLRAILSDPLTGVLMDDAMILPCGHSFSGGGIQHIIRMKACYTCSQLVSEELVAPNLSLRAAVQAFRREEELQGYRSSKRRKERFEQDKSSYGGDSTLADHPRGRGVQFPFVVTDRVIIKGNKRTPQRFVGREAVVTTQCLNGWYVVKTLDNAESVKLQYRSLAKVSDNSNSKAMSSKMTPNWL